MRLYYDEKGIVRLACTSPKTVVTNNCQYVDTDQVIADPIGRRIVFRNKPQTPGLRLAVVCNWDGACGIATYTKYLVDALSSKVADLRIFSEKTDVAKVDSPYAVSYCWSRGESLRGLSKEVLDWQPSVILIQHEYGIFPNTAYMLNMLQMFADTPYAVTLHSVYEHLDKTIVSSAMKHIIVHTQSGKSCLESLGNGMPTTIIPHGCVNMDDTSELWNTWQTEYPIVQFGFGFEYKGVDVALQALSLLKKRHGLKYQKVFYTYFCSENPHVKNITGEYSRRLLKLADELGLQDNVAIIRGFQSDQTLNNILRTSRLALFPYVTDPKNVVYGASGAVRVAMANGVPVIASASHMFDDMEGILPRPKDAEELAESIDLMFSSGQYRQGVLGRSMKYIKDNSWDVTADRYVSTLQGLTNDVDDNVIYV